MDERQSLRLIAWFFGGIVLSVFALNFVAMP